MLDRKSLVSTLWLACSLALLASVPVSPIRKSGFLTVPSGLEGSRLSFALPEFQPTAYLDAAMATDAVPEVDALPSEYEEQDRFGALDRFGASFRIPCSFPQITDRQAIAPRSIPSLYPLRC
jgi:hypothetical protein